MSSRWSYIVTVLLVFVILGLSVGCNRARSDAQIAGDVQQKILADNNVPTKQVTVSSNNGIVTLSGSVGSEIERVTAANDAAMVDGVRTVVNNLTVAQAQLPPPPQPMAMSQPEPAPAPARKPSPRHVAGAPRRSSDLQQAAPAQPAGPAVTPAPVADRTPAAPPPPKPVTVEPGTVLSVRMIDPIDSDRNQIGDRFRATLDTPISINDQVVLPQGADIEGRVAELRSSGHFTGQSEIALELTSLSINGRRYNLQTDQYSRQGASRGKNTAAKVGGGAAVGAILGGIIGGGKGAAIGATVGAGAGTGVQAATKGQQIHIKPEQLLTFRLQSPLTVTPAASITRSGRTISEYNPPSEGSGTRVYSDDSTSQPQPGDSNAPVLKRRPE
ncbi:MAG TPA: BON domain-containing protein [Terriglobales bacterium]|nr:BON domain-containing protein [Terriglobales bacterium]